MPADVSSIAMKNSDVIAAIATPAGRGGIGVVRVSGKDLKSLVLKIAGVVPKARYATLCKFLGPSGEMIDEGIALYFPAPHSYTGEDVLELQGHGSPMVMKWLLASCVSAGARVAEPGEFTLRAFLNDKLDLAQAESVADLIGANTQEAARAAIRSLSGEFSSGIREIVREVTELRALVEAWLDFPEEEIDEIAQSDIEGRLKYINARLEDVFASARRGSLLREGLSVVLVGKPNVGKSSLLNRLAGDEAAIVTEIPGTTRDTIQRVIEIEGVPLHLVDTAGLRDTDDLVESVGIARTRSAIGAAALALVVLDCREGITGEDRAILDSLPEDLRRVYVYNKVDLLAGALQKEDRLGNVTSSKEELGVHVSAKTGAGMESLRRTLLGIAGWSTQGGEGIFMARQRHLTAFST